MKPDRVPFPSPFGGPHYIFRIVKRDERAVYARIMRRTLAVSMRDFNRSINKTARALGKALLPTLERLSAMFGGRDAD